MIEAPVITLLHPCPGVAVSQRFMANPRYYPAFKARNGQMFGPGHEGLDFAANLGTPVLAAHDGVIVDVVRLNAAQRAVRKLQPPYGNHVRLEVYTWGGAVITTIYAHLDRFAPGIARGVAVKAGTVLGYSGDTGRVLGDQTKGYHLHFGTNVDGFPVDPEPLIEGGV